MKVLISALACHPHGSSEDDVGWNWVIQAAKHHEVWVLTKDYQGPAILKELEERPVPNLHFVFHAVPFEKPVWRMTHRFLPVQYISYIAWQITALATARKLHEQVGFDIAHHLTWATYRFPTFLPWTGIPYIWGPVGGGETAPSSLYKSLGKRSSLTEMVRWLSVRLAKLDPLVRKTAGKAAKVVATSEDTKRLMPLEAQSKTVVYPAIGLKVKDLEVEAGPAGSDKHCGGKLLFTGRLIPWKGCSLAVRALATAVNRGVDATLTVAGDGPERESLEALARDLGIEDRVDFLGRVPRSKVLELCRSHDAFIFPSLHDSGGIAVLEAMYLGLPVVCLDLGGPAVSVDDAGIRIKCENSDQVVADLSRAIERLTTEPELRERLIKAARQRVIDHYDWDHKASYIAELYETALTP